MDYIRITYIVLQLIGLVYSNQPNTFAVTQGHSLTATTKDTLILKTRIQCVLRCRQNESCYAVNIIHQGDEFVCWILGIVRFPISDAESSIIGMCHYV